MRGALAVVVVLVVAAVVLTKPGLTEAKGSQGTCSRGGGGSCVDDASGETDRHGRLTGNRKRSRSDNSGETQETGKYEGRKNSAKERKRQKGNEKKMKEGKDQKHMKSKNSKSKKSNDKKKKDKHRISNTKQNKHNDKVKDNKKQETRGKDKGRQKNEKYVKTKDGKKAKTQKNEHKKIKTEKTQSSSSKKKENAEDLEGTTNVNENLPPKTSTTSGVGNEQQEGEQKDLKNEGNESLSASETSKIRNETDHLNNTEEGHQSTAPQNKENVNTEQVEGITIVNENASLTMPTTQGNPKDVASENEESKVSDSTLGEEAKDDNFSGGKIYRPNLLSVSLEFDSSEMMEEENAEIPGVEKEDTEEEIEGKRVKKDVQHETDEKEIEESEMGQGEKEETPENTNSENVISDDGVTDSEINISDEELTGDADESENVLENEGKDINPDDGQGNADNIEETEKKDNENEEVDENGEKSQGMENEKVKHRYILPEVTTEFDTSTWEEYEIKEEI